MLLFIRDYSAHQWILHLALRTGYSAVWARITMIELGEISLKIVCLALEFWSTRRKKSSEISELCDLFQAVQKLKSPEERRRQISALLIPLLQASQKVKGDLEKSYEIHLALAAAYAAIGEVGSQFKHLNQACDCAVVLMDTTWLVETRKFYRSQRDQMLELLGSQRKPLLG